MNLVASVPQDLSVQVLTVSVNKNAVVSWTRVFTSSQESHGEVSTVASPTTATTRRSNPATPHAAKTLSVSNLNKVQSASVSMIIMVTQKCQVVALKVEKKTERFATTSCFQLANMKKDVTAPRDSFLTAVTVKMLMSANSDFTIVNLEKRNVSISREDLSVSVPLATNRRDKTVLMLMSV